MTFKKLSSSSQKNLSFIQFTTVAQLCPTLCDPMDCSTTGFPVHHQLPEIAQTHVHQVSDAIPTISSSVVSFSSYLKDYYLLSIISY